MGAIANALAAHPLAEETLFAVTSPRGYPLGEHGQIGPVREALYSELLQVPLLVRFPNVWNRLVRLPDMLQPADLATTLAEALQLDWSGCQFSPPGGGLVSRFSIDVAPLRQTACAWWSEGLENSQRTIRTPGWLLRETAETAELFVKPDDRFEVNEIATRGGEVPQQLLAHLQHFQELAASGQLSQLQSLDPDLASQWH